MKTVSAAHFLPSCHERTSVWKHGMSHFLRYEQPSVVCTLLGVRHLLPVSLYQWDKSIHSLRHHHSSFPSAPSPNCKHSLTSCPRLWSLTPVSYGSWSPTDVSVPQSPLGCFLAEWRHSLRVSSGDRVRPDQVICSRKASLTNTRLGKLIWLLVIYSANLSVVCMSTGQSKDKMGLSRK